LGGFNNFSVDFDRNKLICLEKSLKIIELDQNKIGYEKVIFEMVLGFESENCCFGDGVVFVVGSNKVQKISCKW
jgi:hypothetical protein